MYIAECRKWCRGGQHLLDASTNEIDKELKITNPLHKKKIHLAIDSMFTDFNVISACFTRIAKLAVFKMILVVPHGGGYPIMSYFA